MRCMQVYYRVRKPIGKLLGACKELKQVNRLGLGYLVSLKINDLALED